MKNVIAAAALSLVLSDFTYANEQRDEAMMKMTPPPLWTLIFTRSHRRWHALVEKQLLKICGHAKPSRPGTVAS